MTLYPATAAERNRWVLARRGAKNRLDPKVPYAFFYEEEIGQTGEMVPTATLLLTNRECPYRCLMCDLWQNTLDQPTPIGAIPAQIEHALQRLPATCQIKLYNAGSFFDPVAIPTEDDRAIARLLIPFERVIVESHPALVGDRCLRFRDSIAGRLEVAIGLETAHPDVLQVLNKRFTVDDFRRSADFLARNGIDLRVFLLVRPPFMTEEEGLEWACRSLDLVFDCGTTACTLIPTRAGNGAMEALASEGLFSPPSLRSLESALEYGLHQHRARVFADTWDISRFATCPCSERRIARITTMNQTQTLPPSIPCNICQ